jgi:putative cell wall-binding protein
MAWLDDLKSFDKSQASHANLATRNHISKSERTELQKRFLNRQTDHLNHASKMVRDRKLREILEVPNESDQFTCPNMERSGMKRCTSKGQVLYGKHDRTITTVIERDWQKVKTVSGNFL